ncbi:MAG: LysM peptidoglycan-binding domain-containing protein [Actinomycetes bacterium]|jgi:LysM repeat protein|uniref:Unannotated protein n=1 Tax=freshwater metagenome TaxID=449393 RepID=A0A6J6G6B2_9ZZZZ|nr:LysM peptidoglycan-binding domain-containing protein [Actinomycetota bacterium]
MSAVSASLAPRSTVRRPLAVVPTAPVATSFARRTAAAGPTSLPSRYTVPAGVLPRRLAGGRTVPRRATFVRRRVGAVVFVVALVCSVGSVTQRGLADRGVDPASGAAVGRATTYVVQPGDTLWGIAARFYPQADQAEVVDLLVAHNGGATIQAGQALDLP